MDNRNELKQPLPMGRSSYARAAVTLKKMLLWKNVVKTFRPIVEEITTKFAWQKYHFRLCIMHIGNNKKQNFTTHFFLSKLFSNHWTWKCDCHILPYSTHFRYMSNRYRTLFPYKPDLMHSFFRHTLRSIIQNLNLFWGPQKFLGASEAEKRKQPQLHHFLVKK